VYSSDHPDGGLFGRGFGVGYEHALSRRIALRGFVSMRNSFSSSDDISCYLTPQGACMADSYFARRLWGLEALALVRPITRVPVRILVALGILWGHGARRALRDAPSIDTTLGGPRATLRAGLEVTLGRSPHAPLLHLSRVAQSQRVLSMTRFWTFGLVIRPF
jgi:hypothetical protein